MFAYIVTKGVYCFILICWPGSGEDILKLESNFIHLYLEFIFL